MPIRHQNAPTVAERIAALPPPAGITELPAPDFLPNAGRFSRVICGLECFARHMTDEGHQLQQGLAKFGDYELWGPHFDNNERDVSRIIAATDPAVVIMQDKREWDSSNGACLDPSAGFTNSGALQTDPCIFKLTICKDAHSDPEYHRYASFEIGCHAWITYYHPDIVHHVAPWTRKKHLIRTWHSIDIDHIAPFLPAGERMPCVVSGAASDLYPLRQRVIADAEQLGVIHLRHPGYHARRSHTANYLGMLNFYKVAICTASKFGYSLRKITESVAAGCIVITDLPPDDVLPQIDDCLVRVHPDIPSTDLRELIAFHAENYCEERQRHFAARAAAFYDYRRRGRELAGAIEAMRRQYGA